MTNKHIVLVVSSLSGGGAARVIIDLAHTLVEHKYKVTLFTLSGEETSFYKIEDSVNWECISIFGASTQVLERIRAGIKRIRLIRKRILSLRPDLVISFIDITNIRVLISLWGLNIPIIVSERTDPRHHQISRLWHLLRRIFYPFAIRVVVQTEAVRRQWALSFLPNDQVIKIGNAVRKEYIDPITYSRPLELPSDRIIMAVGRLSNEKGFDILIRAFFLSKVNQIGWSLVIVGEGHERRHLIQLVKELNLNDNVFLVGSKKDLINWYKSAEIFVLSSRYEGFPNVLLEAMQLGVASIAFDCESGPREIVIDNQNGLLISAEHTEKLAEAISKLAQDKSLRGELGREGQKTVLTQYAFEKIQAEWIKTIKQIC